MPQTAARTTGSPLLPIFAIVLVDVLGLTIILPLLPFYAKSLGASATVVGLLISSYAFCQLIAGPILGRMSDHTGRKPLLIVSQVGTFAGFLLLAYSHTLWLVFLSRIIDGLTAGNLSLAQAYIADVTLPENRAKSFGIIGIAFGVGFLIGPGISGYLSQFGYQVPIFCAAALSATSIVCTTLLLPKTEPHPPTEDAGPGGRRPSVFEWQSYAEFFQRPQLGNLLWQFFCFALSFAFFVGGFALYANQRFSWHGHPFGAVEVGYIFAFVGFLGIVMQGFLIGKLVKRFGERSLVWTGFLSAAIGYSALSWITTPAQLVGASVVASYGTGVIRPAVTSLITQQAGKREQGAVLGVTQSLTSIATVVAPIIAGMLIDRRLLWMWAMAAAITAAVGMMISWRAARNEGDS